MTASVQNADVANGVQLVLLPTDPVGYCDRPVDFRRVDSGYLVGNSLVAPPRV